MARAVWAAKVSRRWSCSGVAGVVSPDGRLDPEHSHRAARRRQREVQRPGARERGAAATRHLAVFLHPLRDGALAGARSVPGASSPARRTSRPSGSGRNTATRLPNTSAMWRVAARSSSSRPCWLTRSRVIEYRAAVRRSRWREASACARTRVVSVLITTRHGQHDRERDEVLGVGHREGQVGSDEEEVEGRDAEDGHEDGGPSPEAPRRQHGAQEVHHDEIGGREVVEHERGHPGADRHDPHGLGVAGPVDGRRGALGRGGLRPLALPGDDVDVDVAAPPDQLVDHRAEQELPASGGAPACPRTMRVTLRRRAYARTSVGDVVPRQRDRLGAELLGQAEGLDDAVAVRVREAGGGRRLHVDDHPLGPQPGGHPPGCADDARGEGTRAHADQDALGHGPDARDGVVAAVDLHLGVHSRRGGPERQLPERDEIALAEEAAHRFPGLLGEVDLPLLEAPDQIVRRQIDQLDLGRLLEDRVRDRLPRRHLRDARDDVVQALEMLDVQRRVDVDPGGEKLRDVLPALGMAGAGSVGVGQLVDEDEGRAAGEGGIEVELAEGRAAVLDRRGGSRSSPGRSASVSARPCVSTQPITTSTPAACWARAASSIA